MARSSSVARPGSHVRRSVCSQALSLAAAFIAQRHTPALAAASSARLEQFTFSERSLGLDLAQTADGRVRIARVRPDSAAIAKGVAPNSFVISVNGQSTADLSVEAVQSLVRSAQRPVTLELDAAAFRALEPAAQTEQAAAALGMQSDRVRIELLTGPQDPSCAFKTREGDVVEVEYSATLAATGREFDSSEMRSGRPYAFMLGNGDVLRGLELGTFEMCIGEERRVLVPPLLGFGRRGSKIYGVPPDASLAYRIKLKSINMQTDPRMRRADVDDEQRFSEDASGQVVNAGVVP